MNRVLMVSLLMGGVIAGVFAQRYAADARLEEYVVKFREREKEYPTTCRSEGAWSICKMRRTEYVDGEYVPVSD